MRVKNQIFFWIGVLTLLTFLFSTSLKSLTLSFYFVTFLFPVALGTSLMFNYFLIPKYLLKGRKWKVSLYLVYTVIVSVYLELLVIILAFAILADYQFQNLGQIVSDIYLMTIILYFVVFANGMVEAYLKLREKDAHLAQVIEEMERDKHQYLIVKSDRKNVRLAISSINYVESLSDYVRIHTANEQIITKEKISALAEKLPSTFLRIHRSFLVNSGKVSSFNTENVRLENVKLPIGRKYRKEIRSLLS